MIGMVKFKEPLVDVRNKLIDLKNDIILSSYLNQIPSIKKKIDKNNFYFHATDDPAEVRMKVYELIKQLDCSFECVVGRKIPAIFEKKHKSIENEFYADILSHLLKNKFSSYEKLILNISERGSSTSNKNLNLALNIAKQRFTQNNNKEIKTNIGFNILNHTIEPLLNIADYFCWTVQRVFEKGETRYYDFIYDKISLIIDLYDASNYKDWANYYSPKHRLTKENLIK